MICQSPDSGAGAAAAGCGVGTPQVVGETRWDLPDAQLCHMFSAAETMSTSCYRSFKVQRGAAAGEEADAETEGDRGQQERNCRRSGWGQTEVTWCTPAWQANVKLDMSKCWTGVLYLIREVEEDKQLNEMMKNLGKYYIKCFDCVELYHLNALF